MNTFHAFDKRYDEFYDINSFPNVYLTEEQVLNALKSVHVESTKDAEVCNLIVAIENLQRAKCAGHITEPQMFSECQQIHKKFRAEFGGWAYTTNAYKSFYSSFGCENE